MATIQISTAAAAARSLLAAARRADTGDKMLTTREIHAARGKNGDAATDALLIQHRDHRNAIRRDPEISDADKPAAMRFMDIEEIEIGGTIAVAQLKRIDQYKGTKNPPRPAGDRDGFVTGDEISNYHYSKGKLQFEASRLAAFTLDPRR